MDQLTEVTQIQFTLITSDIIWLPVALPIYLKKILPLMMMRRLDLPVRDILVGKGQYLNNDLKAPEKSAKADDNRAWTRTWPSLLVAT